MSTLRKRIGFALAVAALGLGVAEGALRLVGDSSETVVSPLAYQRYSGSAFTAGREPGTRVYVSGRRRVVTNAKSGIRILVFGASAAYGEMFSPYTAFAGVAERLLRDANPSTPIEVLNLSHGGMGSRQVGEMVYRALENDSPDAIVVYTGNNEYHELRALKARSDRYDPGAELLRRRLSASALYRFLRDTFVPEDTTLTPPEGEEWLPIGRLDVTVDADDRALGVQLYREHLASIARAAENRGVPLIVTTVPTNLRDHVDRGTPGQASEAENRALAELRGLVNRVPDAQFSEEAAGRATSITTEAGLHALGNLYVDAKRTEEALDAFRRKELAALRPMTSNHDLRGVVNAMGEAGDAVVCDLAGALEAANPHGVPGSDMFIDHCHPNAEGHRHLGVALAHCLADLGLTGLTGEIAARPSEPANPFRVDHYTGHRPIPGFASNPGPADPSTTEGLALAGHQAFVSEQYQTALAAYQRAASRPDAPAEIQHSIGLTHLHLQQLGKAREAFRQASESGIDDARRVLETLSR